MLEKLRLERTTKEGEKKTMVPRIAGTEGISAYLEGGRFLSSEVIVETYFNLLSSFLRFGRGRKVCVVCMNYVETAEI